MLQKVFIKVSILGISLAFVVMTMNFFSTSEFKRSLNDFFGFDVKTYSWCPEHTVDFKWLDENVPAKWKNASIDKIEAQFCKVTLEPILNVDLKKIKFKQLLQAQSAEAKTATLEWNEELKVFQANGLPFNSTSLSREILDR